MSYPCDTVTIPPAEVLVGAAHANFFQLAQQTYNLAVTNMNGLQNITLLPIEFTASFDYDGALSGFQRPARPDFDTAGLEFRDPGSASEAPAFVASPVVLDAAPSLDIDLPVLAYVPRPDAPNVPLPARPTGFIDIDVPLPPDYVLPAVPTLFELQLPDVPVVEIPEFVAEAPVFVEPPINENWTFDPKAYASTLLTELQSKIRSLIQGQDALPPAIVEAMFARGRSRIEVETARSVQTIMADFASRGFAEPPGMLAARVDEARQAGQNQISEMSRDVAIKEFEEALANLRFALERGAALEGVTINLHIEEQRMQLQAAQFLRESAIAIANYRISIYNAQMQGYQIEAQVFRDRLSAAMTKVEIFRAQIEGERARGEINDQKVRVYESMLRGLQAMAQLYRDRVEAVKVQSSVNQQLIDTYKADLEAYGERWRAHVAEWQGFSAAVEGEGQKANIFGTLVRANSDRVSAWSTAQNLKLEAEKLRMGQHDQSLDAWKAGLALIGQRLDGEKTRMEAVSRRLDALARIYSADAELETAASAASDRTHQLGLQREQARVDTYLKVVDMRIAQAKGLIDQAIEVKKTLSATSTQLAASTMSAVSYSASVNSGWNQSKSCSQSFNFNGEIADA